MAIKNQEQQIGDLLVEQGVITPLQLDEALQRQRLTGDMIGRVLVSMEYCKEEDVIEALGVQSGMERVDLTKLKINEELIRKIPGDVAKFYNIIPIREVDGALIVAMADPLNLQILDDLGQITGQEVRGAVSNQEDVSAAWKANYAFEIDNIHEMLASLEDLVGTKELSLEEMGTQMLVGNTDNLTELAQQPEVIKIVNLVFLEAVQKRASDIHFETFENDFRIRIRIDGLLQEIVSPPKAMSIPLISRVKIMCNMDISERRLPQDQRIELKVGDTTIDIRVSTLPALFGECVVMRILDRSAIKIGLSSLGITDKILKIIDMVIHKPNGIMLVTGPTGSGKTTTLYGCLADLNTPDVKIITTEDPVELQIEQLVQCQVRESIGLTFASCLRAILRQDPDIIMIGEIRDLETAQIAIEASLTGHMVLSTLHTNSAPETVTRLLDMDVEPFLITASLEGVIAQRLMRRLCRDCKEMVVPSEEEIKELGIPKQWASDPKLRVGKSNGCPACDYRGYTGRTGIYEMLTLDEGLGDLILERAMAFDIRRYARKNMGMTTLREEAILQCVKGVTSAEEVITHTDHFED